MDEKNIYDKLKEMLDKTGGKYTILEEQVDVDLQMKFFEFASKVRKNKKPENEILKDIPLLYSDETSLEEKKKILAELSDSENVECFRELEKYIKVVEPKLKPWAILSFQHCRIGLESKLLDENKVFISTGLGGKDDKLRYFIAFKNKTGTDYSDIQKKVVENEFQFIYKHNNCIIEKIEYLDQYLTLLCIMPVDCVLNDIITSAINEVNLYGDFLHKVYLITNVKILKKKDIEYYFNKKEEE